VTAPTYAQSGTLNLGNAYASVWALTRFDTVLGRWVPLQGAVVTVALTTDLAGSPQVSVTAPETAVAGTYAVTIPAATIDAAFSAATLVYERVTAGGSAVGVKPLTVAPVRYVL
jgi:hypothetical protein